MTLIKTHQIYLIQKFLKNLLKIIIIFLCIIFIMSLFEEINFFKDTNEKFYIPIFLSILNLPSVLFEVFPFIFLISAILFFFEIFDADEISVLKTYGITNLKILKILTFTSIIISILIITIFYSFSTTLKTKYLETKNKFSKDDKYLAVITSNGLWIRDIIDSNINFINADKIKENHLLNVTISKFDKNFKLIHSLQAEKADIKKNKWLLKNLVIYSNNQKNRFDEVEFNSNFNLDKLLSLFNNLSALSLFEIEKLKNDYRLLGYSTDLLDGFKLKIYTYPIYLTFMLLIGSILMLNFNPKRPKFLQFIYGILISVMIYYLNYFITNIAETRNFSYFIPTLSLQIFLFLIILSNLIKINEK